MGKNAPPRPEWAKTLDGLITQGGRVTVSCTQCSKHDIVDLNLLRQRVCKGWSRFRYVNGMAWALWDNEGAKRWGKLRRAIDAYHRFKTQRSVKHVFLDQIDRCLVIIVGACA